MTPRCPLVPQRLGSALRQGRSPRPVKFAYVGTQQPKRESRRKKRKLELERTLQSTMTARRAAGAQSKTWEQRNFCATSNGWRGRCDNMSVHSLVIHEVRPLFRFDILIPTSFNFISKCMLTLEKRILPERWEGVLPSACSTTPSIFRTWCS
jgi:hypothetical protein